MLRFTCKQELEIELLHIWEEFGQFGKAGIHIPTSHVFLLCFGDLSTCCLKVFQLTCILFADLMTGYLFQNTLQNHFSPVPDFYLDTHWARKGLGLHPS